MNWFYQYKIITLILFYSLNINIKFISRQKKTVSLIFQVNIKPKTNFISCKCICTVKKSKIIGNFEVKGIIFHKMNLGHVFQIFVK